MPPKRGDIGFLQQRYGKPQFAKNIYVSIDHIVYPANLTGPVPASKALHETKHLLLKSVGKRQKLPPTRVELSEPLLETAVWKRERTKSVTKCGGRKGEHCRRRLLNFLSSP